jgi:hypothetical protein
MDSSCLPDTRVGFLQEVRYWFTNGTHAIYWLSGNAGTGKSTIAHSVCIQQEKHLGGAFFFSRKSADRQDPSRVIPTLVYQLADAHPSLRPYICNALENNRDIAFSPVEKQARVLLEEPFKDLNLGHIAPLVFVLDALDECDKQGGALMPLLVKHILSLPFPAKIFFTGRPESNIRRMMKESSELSLPFVLHRDIDKVVVNKDIESFLRLKFAYIARKHEIEEKPWPTDDQLTQLLKSADCLFIYASTAVTFVSAGTLTKRQLLAFLATDTVLPTAESPYAALDELYLRIIKDAVRGRSASAEFREVIGSVLVLQRPLNEHAISRLLQKDADDVHGVLQGLYSVLDMSKANDPIKIFHASSPTSS